MTKIIVFSGNSNTGKTSAIHYLKEKYGASHPEKKIKLFGETAREFIEMNNGVIDDVKELEKFVANKEIKRLAELERIKKTGEYDLVFIDRSSLDGIIYCYWQLLHGEINSIDFIPNYYPVLNQGRELYDKVVFFTTPIKIDKRFPIYNNQYINTIFENSIRYFYGEKVLIFTNNIFFQDNVESTIFGNLFEI